MKRYFKASFYFLPLLPIISFFILDDRFFHLDLKEIFGLVAMYLIVFFLGLAVYPLMSLLFPDSKDKAYGASRVLGLVLFTYIVWSFFGFFDLPVTHWGLVGILLFMAFLFLLVIFIRDDAFLFIRNIEEIVIIETLFGCVFLLFLTQASFHPEIYGGEKSMDYSLLFSFHRLEFFPPHDPWASSSILRYYYWGYLTFAKLLQTAKLDSPVGYLVCMAFLPALFATTLYSFLLSVLKNRFLSLLGALSLVFASNYQGLMNLLTKVNWDFAYFWSSTRIFQNDLFAEYPSWSFSFLDLHPHVMGYPFFALGLLFVWRFLNKRASFSYFECIVSALVFGAIFVTNLWDYLILSLLLSFVVLFTFKKRWWSSLIVLCLSLLFYLPVIIRMLSGRSQGGEFLTLERSVYNGFLNYLSHYGAWWILSLYSLLILVIIYFFKKKKMTLDFASKSFLLLALGATVLVLFSNYFVLIDKINTLFKLNTEAWVLFGCAVFFLLRRFIRFPFWSRFAFFFLPILFLSALVTASVINVIACASLSKSTWIRPSLNTNAFLINDDPITYRLISKINEDHLPIGNLLEPYGKTYDFESNRISLFTGLPSFLVWAGQHVNQRGLPWSEIQRRKGLVDSFYDEKQEMHRCPFLKKENIRYVFLKQGNLTLPCLQLIYKEGEMALFERPEE